MVSSSRSESLAHRCAPYIDELQDFFRARKVPFGKPADLLTFPDHLADPAFADEMVSMVRSVFYRENEALPFTELSEMVALAVGGPQVDEPSAEFNAALKDVSSFVTAVARPPRAVFPGEVSEVVGPAATAVTEVAEVTPPVADTIAPRKFATPEAVQAAPGASSNVTSTSPPPLHEPPHAAPLDVPTIDSVEPSVATPANRPTNDRLSRVLAHTEASSTETFTARPPDSAARTPGTFAPTPTRSQPRSLGAFLRNAYWIPGLCVLLLALGAIFFMRSRPTSEKPQKPVQAAAVQTSSIPKPSAYGTPLHKADPVSAHLAADAAIAAPAEKQPPTDLPTAPSATASALAAGTVTTRRSTLHSGNSPTKPATILIPGMREGVFLASSGMMAAHLLSAPAPNYPKLASFARVEGEVIVQVVVSRDGSVEATRVLQGPRLLRGAAEHAIRRWRYRPYIVDGRPTDVATIVTVTFQLRH